MNLRVAAAVAVAAAVFAVLAFDVGALFERLKTVDPVTAALASVAIGVVSTLAMLTTTPLNLFAGAQFGTVGGGLVTVVALQLGAMAAFALARSNGTVRQWCSKQLVANATFSSMAAALSGAESAKLIFLLRLAPIFPFALVNYVLAAVPGVSFTTFSVATLAGNLPACFLYANAAASASSASAAGGWRDWVMPVASVVAVVVISSMARRIMAEEERKAAQQR